jgi:dephospho-CoA kinase
VLRVGLTGGIACGKTRVRRALAAAGLPTLDLDAVAHDVILPGRPAHAAVAAAFGAEVLAPDGSVDRARLGALVFADPEKRRSLNAIVHPRVREEEARWAAGLAGGAGPPVVDAALLVEAGVHLRFDRLVVVRCAPEQQLARLRARDGLEEAAARARIAAQMPLDDKARFAHAVVDTSGALEETDRRAQALAGDLRALAAGWRPEAVSRARAASLVAAPAGEVRGLGLRRLLEAIAAGGVDLPDLGRGLQPPAGEPWYAQPGRTVGAEPLMAAVALWSSARGAGEPFACTAALSLARLLGADTASATAACLAVLVLHRALLDAPADAAAWPWRAWAEAARVHGGDDARASAERLRAAATGEAGGPDWLAGALRASAGPPDPRALELVEGVLAAR